MAPSANEYKLARISHGGSARCGGVGMIRGGLDVVRAFSFLA